MFPEFQLLFLLVPALLFSLMAQAVVRSAWTKSGEQPARMSGYAAARHVLDGAGLYDVTIEQVPGQFGEHYDRSLKTLRLGSEIYHGRSLGAVGMAAHEAGHAIQDAAGYRLLAIRQVAVPASSFGSGAGILMAALGLILGVPQLLGLGVLCFTASVAVQLLNLPVEINASMRARRLLTRLDIIRPDELPTLQRALNAGSLRLLAGTLQSLFTLVQSVAGWFQPRDD